MAVSVIMPRQGNSVESCIVTKWHKAVGEAVAEGDLLFSYETDKAAFDEEAKQAGTLLRRYFEEGDDVPCLADMCVIGEPGEQIEQGEAPRAIAEAAPEPVLMAQAAATADAEAAKGAVEDTPISPRARKLLERRNVLLGKVVPTGPDGRVIERDVREAIAAGYVLTPAAKAAGLTQGEGGIGGRVAVAAQATPNAQAPEKEAPAKAAEPNIFKKDLEKVKEQYPDYTEEPLSHMRKVIAKTMAASLRDMAQLTHTTSFDASDIQALRARFKSQGEEMGLSKITLNDILLYAVSRVLARPEYAALNANLIDGETMRYFHNVHLGMAVDTPRGLMVPTIFDADTKSLKQISAEAKSLAKSCQEGTINPDLLRGGTFTVSNLGIFGIESFTPVINPPQTAILGVNAITTRVREKNGSIEAYPAMGLSLTYDHRALDGTPASRFLRDLCKALESFQLLLAAG